MRRVFEIIAIAVVLALIAGVAWSIYGKSQISAAEQLDESMEMVSHQTANMSEALEDIGEFIEVVEIAKVTQVNELITLWEPFYDSSRTIYERFDASIILAEQRAIGYLEAKKALTELYHDPEKQAEARLRDEEEQALFEVWLEQAYQTREDAWDILLRFEDMDTDLRRLRLTAEFVFDAGLLDSMSAEVADLNAQLADFQTASENIQAVTKSPFAVEG